MHDSPAYYLPGMNGAVIEASTESASPASAEMVQDADMCEPAAKRSKCMDPEDADDLEYLNDVKVNVLQSSDTTTPITHIAHISDVHIRRNDRFEEYDHVFAQLYKGLRELKGRHPGSIAVIAGDVVHSKCNMHSNGADAAWEFFKSLSDIMPVIVVPGNHDGQVHNAHAKNTLSTLLRDRMHTHPIHLLLHSGAYRYNNVVFGVSSIFDGKFVKAESIIADLEEGGTVKIALYHGAVGKGTRISYGYISPQGIGIQVFRGYDFALLGDIHKHQYLNPGQTMAYPGSLISQDFGETDDDHGWIEWDLALRKPAYHRVPNDYAHKSIDFIDQGKVKFDGVECDAHSIINQLPKKAHLRIMYKGDLVSVNRFEKSLLDSLPHLTVKKIPMLSESMVQCLPVLSVPRPGDLLNDQELASFIASSYPKLTSEEVMETMKALAKEMSTIEDYVEFGESDWTPLQLKFSNLYAYGANNVIDFTKLEMNGVVGLFAPNTYGKSSVLDILSIAMFGKTTSEGILHSTVINETQESFDTSLYFRTKGGIHCVERKGTKSNMSLICKLYHLVPKEQTTIPNTARTEVRNFMGEELYLIVRSHGSNNTLKAITKLVGTFNCFRLTSMCLQNGISDSSLIAMKNADRKVMLMKLFNLDAFDKMHAILKPKLTNAQSTFDSLGKSLVALGDPDKVLSGHTTELATVTNSLKSIEGTIKDLEGCVAVARASRHNVPFSEEDVKEKLAALDTGVLVTKMEEIKKKLAAKDNEEVELQRKIDGLVLVGEKKAILEAHEQFELNKKAVLEKLQRDEKARRSEVRPLYRVTYDGSKHEAKLKDFEKLEQQFEALPANLKGLKFSGECDCCKHNRYVLGQMETGTVVEYSKMKEQLEKLERDKKLFEENQKITEHNQLIEERLHDIQREREEINERKDERHELWKHQDKEHGKLTAKMLAISKEQKKLISEHHQMEGEMAKEKKTDDELKQMLVDIDRNQKMDKMVGERNKELDRKKEEKEKLTQEHIDLIRKVAAVEKDVQLYNQQMEEYGKVSEEKTMYQRLEHITSPNGYSLHMLKKYIPHICQSVNDIIGMYMDRNVDMKLEGKSINLESIPRDQESPICPISTFSGMERFMVDIAIKIVLGKMARVPRSSLIFIDEGMSVMDQDRMARIGDLFQFLRDHFHYSFVISHIDTVEEHVDVRLHITKEGRLSKIDNT